MADWYGARLAITRLWVRIPPSATVHQRQLSVPSLQGRLMSTSENWGVNGHTTRCTSPVSVVLWLRLVSGWGLINGDQRRPMGPWGSGKDFTLFYPQKIGGTCPPVHSWIYAHVHSCIRDTLFTLFMSGFSVFRSCCRSLLTDYRSLTSLSSRLSHVLNVHAVTLRADYSTVFIQDNWVVQEIVFLVGLCMYVCACLSACLSVCLFVCGITQKFLTIATKLGMLVA